jgi:phosphatidylglycerol:prolipoprotein diacylglycerol transferase
MPPDTVPESLLHNWSGFWPFLRIGSVEIPTYHLLISLALCVAVFYLRSRTRLNTRSGDPFATHDALDLAISVMVGGFLGARLLHIFFEAPAYYFRDPVQMLHIERGGFVWYGGVIGGVACGLGFLRWKRLRIRPWLDLVAPVVALGYGLGRIACVVTGCCFGDVCTLVPTYPVRYPTQLFAVLWELLVFVILVSLENRSRKLRTIGLKLPGQLFALWLILHAVGRLIMESVRADDRGPNPFGLSISSWISLLLILSAVGLAVSNQRKMSLR